MATIQYTTYTFHKPPLIDENQYDSIRLNLQHHKNYKPFPVESFWEKFKILILFYIVGLPVALSETAWRSRPRPRSEPATDGETYAKMHLLAAQ